MEELNTQELTEQPQVLVQDKPAQELSEEQQLFLEGKKTLQECVLTVLKYSGSKKQLQNVIKNIMLNGLIDDEELKFSYPEEKELFEQFKKLNNFKFLLGVAQLESSGKIKYMEGTNEKEQIQIEQQ